MDYTNQHKYRIWETVHQCCTYSLVVDNYRPEQNKYPTPQMLKRSVYDQGLQCLLLIQQFLDRSTGEPAHNKTCKTCVTSKDSDQPPNLQSDQFLLIACAFYNIQAIQRGINENPCQTVWMYRMICVFAGLRDLITGFVVHLFKSWNELVQI